MTMSIGEFEPLPAGEDSDENRRAPSYQPSPEEQKLVRKVERMLLRNKKYRARVDYKWADYYKLFRGKQWKDWRPSYRASEVFNLCFQALQSQVPIITDAKPKMEYVPRDPSDAEFAQIMNDISSAEWEEKNWLFTLTEIIYDSHIYGTGISALTYNLQTQQIEYVSKSPFYIYPDPAAQSFLVNCSSVVEAEPISLETARKLYPKHAKYLTADAQDIKGERNIDLNAMQTRTVVSDQIEIVPDFNYSADTPDVLISTAYFQDDASEDYTDEGGEKGKKLKYPQGRKVVTANSMVLTQGPFEYDDGKYPYQRLVNYILPRSIWGISEFEALESPQQTFNKVVSSVLDVLYLMGNPIYIIDSTSGVDSDNLTNQPGLVVEKEPGSEVRRESGVQLQSFVLPLIDRLKQWFDQLGGSQDITRGVPAGGVTAASAIEDLQNAAQTRVRQKSRNLDAYLQDFGQQYASRVMQFYTAPRVFRITNSDGANRFFKAHFSKSPEGRRVANVQHYTENGLPAATINQYELTGELDLRVSTGTSLSFSKAKNEQRLFNLFDRKIIDAEEVLKDLDFPHWQAIIQRMHAGQSPQSSPNQQGGQQTGQ